MHPDDFHCSRGAGIKDETIIVLNSDHGETLYDHDCYFDHHGLYDPTLHVPRSSATRESASRQARKRLQPSPDLAPTLMELAEINPGIPFDGQSLMKLVSGEVPSFTGEFYITECTWMRKHGWRTPQWKLIVALEPDFHFKPPVELYDLIEDPLENNNLAEALPEVVNLLKSRMEAWIARRTSETGLPDPIYHQGDWHGHKGIGSFTSSQQAYDTLHIGDPNQAAKLQSESR